MFSETPELYDLIYLAFKDYRGEAASIAAKLREVAPAARTVLDVACGTGEHARYLHDEHGYAIDGLDIEPGFVDIAAGKLLEGRVFQGDMSDFALDSRYDAIICMFSSIGYLCEPELVERALRCFHRHLNSGGVAIVEPWFEPDAWNTGQVHMHPIEADGMKVVRMSHSTLEGRITKLDFHYLIGTADGIEHRVEQHSFGLYTVAEMLDCFRGAGFEDVDHDPEGLIGRGLYTARANPHWEAT